MILLLGMMMKMVVVVVVVMHGWFISNHRPIVMYVPGEPQRQPRQAGSLSTGGYVLHKPNWKLFYRTLRLKKILKKR